MKGHLGTDPRGFVHTLITPNAAQSDIGQLPHLVHGLEDTLHGDKAYWKEADRVAYEAAGGQYLINQRGERSRICSVPASRCSRWARSVGVNADLGPQSARDAPAGAANRGDGVPGAPVIAISITLFSTALALHTCAEFPEYYQAGRGLERHPSV
jgi:hypothetical protein